MNVPVDEVKEIMGEIGGRGMGYLFENMKKMDIQAERRNTQRERDCADMEKVRADSEKERADSEKERADSEKERADSEKERADVAELEIQRLKKELEKRMHVTGK